MTGIAEPMSTLGKLLRSLVARSPDAPAVTAPGRVALDFAGLVGQVDEMHTALAFAGLGPADRVAVPLDPRSRAEELVPYLAEVGARAVIVPRAGEAHPARGDSILDALPGLGAEQVLRVIGALDDRSQG